MIDPYTLIASTALAVILLMGAGFAIAAPPVRRNPDLATALAIPGVVIAAAVAAYAYGLRAHFYDTGTIAVVEIIEPAETTVTKSQVRVPPQPRFSQF